MKKEYWFLNLSMNGVLKLKVRHNEIVKERIQRSRQGKSINLL